jgi:hypothetical protein
VKVTQWSHDGSEHAEEYCDACQLTISARIHERTAQKMHAKARGIYEKYGVDVPRF